MANVGVGDATECVRLRVTPPESASAKRFLFLIMPLRRDCAKSASGSNSDFNRLYSYIFALCSVAGSMARLLALACSTRGRTVEKAAVMWSIV